MMDVDFLTLELKNFEILKKWTAKPQKDIAR